LDGLEMKSKLKVFPVVLPLVDVFIVIMIAMAFLAINSTQRTINIATPESGVVDEKKHYYTITVEIDATGNIYVHGQMLSLDGFREYVLKHREVPLVLHIDKRLEFQRFVYIVSVLKKAGKRDWAVLVKKEEM
jgi:biopolymer transport protein ExbD